MDPCGHFSYEAWVAISTLEVLIFKELLFSFKGLRFMQCPGILERRVFKEPAMRRNQYMNQINRDSINAVMATVQGNHLEEYVMTGADSRYLEMLFAHLTKEQVEVVADTLASTPCFAIFLVMWYQCDGIKSMHCAL